MKNMKPVAWLCKNKSTGRVFVDLNDIRYSNTRERNDWESTPLYAIPEGFVVVPVEPTGKMIDAWFDQLSKNGFHVEGSDLTISDAVATYKAMLKAAQEEG